MVARTLIRVVSSACGMGLSLLDAHRLDETQAQMTQLNQLRLLQAAGQRTLADRGLPQQCLDPLAALLGKLGADGAPVVGIVDAFDQAVALQVVDEAGHRTRGDIEHLRQLAHGDAPGRLVLQAHEDLEAALAEAEPIRPALHGRVQLLPQDADGGQGLRSRLDFSALSPQNLTDRRVEQEAVSVCLELGGVVIGLESELTHIYRAHYYIAQETTQPAIDGGPVTGSARAARRRPAPLGDGHRFLVCLRPATGSARAARLRTPRTPIAATSTTTIASAMLGRMASTNAWVKTACASRSSCWTICAGTPTGNCRLPPVWPRPTSRPWAAAWLKPSTKGARNWSGNCDE